jgi:hypothetical protein
MEEESKNPNSLVISYLLLRKIVGILGMALPIVVYLGGKLIFSENIQSSISSYYYTGMRDVFVGILWTIGFFLYSYKGYEPADNIAGNLACVFAVVVSLFPTTPDGPKPFTTIIQVTGTIHLISASLFLLTLSYFSLVLFTQTVKNPTPEKLKRNMVYKGCGYIMLTSIVLMAVYKIFLESHWVGLDSAHPIFWLEGFATFIFGFSWFTKGEAILADK